MSRDPKNKLFANDNKGFVELYFTPEEVLSMLEILSFTRRMCNTLIMQENNGVSDDMKAILRDKSTMSSLLEEKIKMDADPGRPDGLLH